MRSVHALLLAGGLTLVPASVVLAQPPGGGGPGGMAQWREQHKHTFELRSMLSGGLMELERNKATQLKPAQAKQVLAVLTPLTRKPKLTQAEAKGSVDKLQKVFTAPQRAAVAKAAQAGQRRGGPGGGGPGGGGPRGGGPGFGGGRPGGGPGGPGRPGGGPGGPGGGRGFDPARMKDFNPFNPAKGTPMYDRSVQRNKSLTTFLTARAAGKMDAKLDLGFGGRGGGYPGGYPGGGPGGGPRGGRR